MSSSGEEQIPGYDNRGTMIVSEAHELRRAPVALKDVWDAHWHEIYGRFQHGRGSGYALCLFDDLGNLQATAALAQPSAGLPSTVTLGRHTECGLRVVGDPCVALRHLMLAIAPGSRSLEIVDLRTDPGFHIDSIGAARGALVDGAVSLSFAGMRLVGLPLDAASSWPMFPHEAWRCFFAEPAIRVSLELHHNPAAYRERHSSGTRVSVVRPVLHLEDVGPHWTGEESLPVRPRPAVPEGASSRWQRPTEGSDPKQLELLFGEVENAADFDDADESPDNVVFVDAWQRRRVAAARLTLEGPGGRAVMQLTDDSLERGVLVGRYERCAGHVQGHVFDDGVSRVHALLRCDANGNLVLIDTGSTFGVFVDGARVDCVELNSGQRVWLSPHSSLRLDVVQ